MPYRLTLSANRTIRPQRPKDFSMVINGLMTRRSFIVTEAPETLVDDLVAIVPCLRERVKYAGEMGERGPSFLGFL